MKVMIAVDGSEVDDAAVSTAVELFGTDVDYTVVSVGSPAPLQAVSPLGIAPAMMVLASPDAGDPAGDGERQAAEAAEHMQLPDVHVVSAVGPPGPVICGLAADHEIDVLVIGSHDRGWLDRIFEPAVGRHLVDHAPCHVLVVREEGIQ